jgi:2,4-dienoyl-CoA reductase-like NADH-dependent reductase (Old Yellow Enzyme family)
VPNYPLLFSEGQLGKLRLRNRALVSSLTRASATEKGIVTDQMRGYYKNFAGGGWGAVLSEAIYIDEKYSQGYAFQPGLANEEQADSWSSLVEGVHSEGGLIIAQLFHGGAVNQGNAWVTGSIAPSAVRPKGEQIDRYRGSGGLFQVPREITREEIFEVIASFVEAAKRAKSAGFDGIELHGANGYLPDQFLTTYTNLRSDEFGGSLENRLRFHVLTLEALRKALPDFLIGVRVSQTKVNDLDYVWPGGEKDAADIFTAFERVGVDYIHVAAHLGVSSVFDCPHSLSGLAKKHTRLPVIANGKLHDPLVAEQVLKSQEGDFCSIGKGALADPQWPKKVKQGEAPTPFMVEMVSPYATLDNYYNWSSQNIPPR